MHKALNILRHIFATSALILAPFAIASVLAGCGGGGGGGGSGSGSGSGDGFQTGNACVDGSTQAVTLAWDAVDGADGYRVYYGTDPDDVSTLSAVDVQQVAGPLLTTTTVPGLSSGQTYYFAATAYDSTGANGDISTSVCLNVP